LYKCGTAHGLSLRQPKQDFMQTSTLTPREYWQEIKSRPGRAKFGFGKKAALIHIDLQCAYTDTAQFATAYSTDPQQLDFCNHLSKLARVRGFPVVFTYVAYAADASDAGVWGTRTNTADSLQNIKHGSARAALDPRVQIDASDSVICKRMPSVFFETHLRSLLTWHQVDTVILTGGSTSGCVRASAVDSLSCGFRTIVVEECVADKHEIPHFANLCDLMLKYADVESFDSVARYLRDVSPRNDSI
jgi:maleamate amidohydrolase